MLDGVGDELTVDSWNSHNYHDTTISAWFKTDDANKAQTILSNTNSAADGLGESMLIHGAGDGQILPDR